MFTYPHGHYYGHLWNEALRLHDARVLGIITSDARIADVPRLLDRMRRAFATFDKLWCYAPNVDHTPWQYRLDALLRLSADMYHVPTTDGICWFLRTELAHMVGPVPLEVNHLGWGIDVLAAICCARAGRWTVRDYGITILHPAGSGYSRDEAARQELAMADHLGLGAEYRGYLRHANAQRVQPDGSHLRSGPRHARPRLRPRLRQPRPT